MKIRNRTFKIITLLTLSILMLAFMAVYPVINKTVSAEEINDKNLFDMSVFEYDNLSYIKYNVTYISSNNRAIYYKVDFAVGDEHPQIKSDLFYLSAGTYTLSATYEMSTFFEHTIYLTSQDNEYTNLMTINFNESGQRKSKSFVIEMSGFYYLRILHNLSGINESVSFYACFSDIMLNEGTQALPFVEFIRPSDEIDAINQGSDNIIAKLDELFGAESGIIAGASLGTVILLIAILLVITKRR